MTSPPSAASRRPGRKKKTPRAASNFPDFGAPLDPTRWDELRSELVGRADASAVASTGLFAGESSEPAGSEGSVYLWGAACSVHNDIPAVQRLLAKVASTNCSGSTWSTDERDMLHEHAMSLIEQVFKESMSVGEAAEAVRWAAALPGLSSILPRDVWWQCGEQLLQLRADAALRSDSTSPLHLLIAGELGLTLASRLSIFPSCRSLIEPAVEAVTMFLHGEAESIDRSVADPSQIRLIVASLVRCEKLFGIVAKRRLKKRQREIAAELVTWMAALTRCDGTQVFSSADAKQCRIDYAALGKGNFSEPRQRGKKKTRQTKPNLEGSPELHALMKAACEFDPETLAPAAAAALGQSHSGGRLAWAVSLPETMWHSETGKTVAMMPEWDVRRGRTFLDYSGEDVSVEIMAGRRSLFRGKHQTMITIDGVDQRPTGEWECTCEYSDDDVHLIELEQRFSGDVILQRQWMLVRDDRCLMVSDAVLPTTTGSDASNTLTRRDASKEPLVAPEIHCTSRLPLAGGVRVLQDDLTRELILSTGKKRRALLMPLAANEWRTGPSACEVTISEDDHLVVVARGRGAVYSPVWLDFQTHRFGRKRTWRQLTIAENLAIVPPSVAAAYRIQVGSEQWAIYRSMSGRGPRSVLGKHLIADFFAARFHPGDGGMEELVTVDDSNENMSENA